MFNLMKTTEYFKQKYAIFIFEFLLAFEIFLFELKRNKKFRKCLWLKFE